MGGRNGRLVSSFVVKKSPGGLQDDDCEADGGLERHGTDDQAPASQPAVLPLTSCAAEVFSIFSFVRVQALPSGEC